MKEQHSPLSWLVPLSVLATSLMSSTGVLANPVIAGQRRPMLPARITVWDFAPTWIQGREKWQLLFFSSRDVTGQPQEPFSTRIDGEKVTEGQINFPVPYDDRIFSPVGRSIIAVDERPQLITLLQAPPISFAPAWTSVTSRIAFSRDEDIFILDLKAGSIGRYNDGKRIGRRMPVWSPQGTTLAAAGLHSSSDQIVRSHRHDEDIFVAEISNRLSAVSTERIRCVAHSTGFDELPLYSHDGQWLYFVHQNVLTEREIILEILHPELSLQKQNWSLSRVRPDKSFQDAQYEVPQDIIKNLWKLERIDWFPDGTKIFLSYAGNEYEMKNPPEIVDIEAKTKTALKLPVLLDPDLPKGKPLVPREIAVSPDGKQIAFSALRWSGDPKDDGAILIYTCNLDGTNLKRITPPTNEPLEPYKYPQEGVTALNAWEKLQPKPNTGTGVKFGDFEAREKLIEKYRVMEEEAKKQAEQKQQQKVQ